MSAIIIGGNECMGRKYVDVCRRYACEAKVFALSHTMAQNAAREARRRGLKLIRLPKGSAAALEQALRRHVG